MGKVHTTGLASEDQELLLTLRKAGLDADLVRRITELDGDDLALRLRNFIRGMRFEPSASQKQARELMGRNFFGIEEAVRHFSVEPSESQLVALSRIPFEETIIESRKNTHILAAVFPLSITDILSRVNRDLFYHHNLDYWQRRAFARDCGQLRWHLIRKAAIQHSASKSREDQLRGLNLTQGLPSARVLVYVLIGHYLASGQRLFESAYVRSSDVIDEKPEVIVGNFDQEGLDIKVNWVSDRLDNLGIADSYELG
jgi:hypothetical protein